jgi:hypothetical protein
LGAPAGLHQAWNQWFDSFPIEIKFFVASV